MAVKNFFYVILCLTFVAFAGCSSSGNPVDVPENIPDVILSSAEDLHSATGIMGAYELIVDPDSQSVELIPKRSSALGQSYLVSGLSFFTIAPCGNCFTMRSIEWLTDGFRITFRLTHPFEQGNTGEPSSAKNRLDLDVFDVALVVLPYSQPPYSEPPVDYAQLNVPVWLGYVKNQDGYTQELMNRVTEPFLLPYFLFVDDSETGNSTYNKFAMGSSSDLTVDFNRFEYLRFDLFITMGYGWSATWESRFDPLYFNPEYNRKAAWKVEARPLGYWDETDNTTPVNVEVKVYDWQVDATVYSTPDDFVNAPSNNVYAASEVERVSVEIPGMTSTLQSTTTPDSGSGTPTDPLIYNIPVINQNSLAEGTYIGLVKVKDNRPCLQVSDGRDILVDSPDGISFEYYTMNEYATYQTFKATVTGNSGWARSWGSTGWDYGFNVATDNDGYIYAIGSFTGTVDFDPDPDNSIELTSPGYSSAYLCKYDPSGNLVWVRTWGSENFTTSTSIACSNDYIVVCGSFTDTCDFDPDPIQVDNRTSKGDIDVYYSVYDADGDYIGTTTIGGTGYEYGYSIDIDPANKVIICGSFSDTVDFDPSSATEERTSNGESDSFICAYDSTGGLLWVHTWGSSSMDAPTTNRISPSTGNIIVCGMFQNTVDFDPTSGVDNHTSNGQWDCFFSFFNGAGQWQFTRTWGGLDQDLPANMAFDLTGNFYVSGYFRQTVDFDPMGGVDNHTSVGNQDSFLSKYDTAGNYEWTYTWGGNNTDNASGLATDSDENVYVCGEYANTTDFDPTGGVFTRPVIDGTDMYISKFDNSGNYLWTKTFHGMSSQNAFRLATYKNDFIYITGYFHRSVDFDPASFYEDIHYSNGESDVFLLKLLPDGSW